MKKILLFFFVFATIGFTVSSHSQTFWQKTKYGMSIGEVKKAYPEAISLVDGGTLIDGAKALLVIENYQLLKNKFHINFYFKNDKLVQVMISIDKNEKSTPDLFNKVEELLDEAYGKAVQKEVNANRSGYISYANAVWRNQKTRIRVFFMGGGTNILNINYQFISDAGKL